MLVIERDLFHVNVSVAKNGERTYFTIYDVAQALGIENYRKEINYLTINENESSRNMFIHNQKLFASEKFAFMLALKAGPDKAKVFLVWLINSITMVQSAEVVTEYLTNKETLNDIDRTSEHEYYAVTQIAKKYGLTGSQLNNILYDAGIQYKVNEQWVLYSNYQDKGFTVTVTLNKNGHNILHTYWTKVGMEFIELTLSLLGYSREHDQMSLF